MIFDIVRMQYLHVIPFFTSCLLNNRLQLRKAQKVHVPILLLIVLVVSFCKLKCVERVVGRR